MKWERYNIKNWWKRAKLHMWVNEDIVTIASITGIAAILMIAVLDGLG